MSHSKTHFSLQAKGSKKVQQHCKRQKKKRNGAAPVRWPMFDGRCPGRHSTDKWVESPFGEIHHLTAGSSHYSDSPWPILIAFSVKRSLFGDMSVGSLLVSLLAQIHNSTVKCNETNNILSLLPHSSSTLEPRFGETWFINHGSPQRSSIGCSS